MSLFNRMLDAMGFREEADGDDDYYYDDDVVEEVVDQSAYREPLRQRSTSASRLSRYPTGGGLEVQNNVDRPIKARIVLMQPVHFENAQTVVTNLLKGDIVVIDLQSTDVEDAVNIVNFVSGAIFAIQGNIQKINDQGAIFICLPSDVELDNELHRSLEDTINGPSVSDWVNRTRGKHDL